MYINEKSISNIYVCMDYCCYYWVIIILILIFVNVKFCLST